MDLEFVDLVVPKPCNSEYIKLPKESQKMTTNVTTNLFKSLILFAIFTTLFAAPVKSTFKRQSPNALRQCTLSCEKSNNFQQCFKQQCEPLMIQQCMNQCWTEYSDNPAQMEQCITQQCEGGQQAMTVPEVKRDYHTETTCFETCNLEFCCT